MPAPLAHSDLSTFMGSWPVVPEAVSGTPIFDSRVLDRTAVILGVKRETSAGFNVNGKSMYIWVDGTQHQVSFSGTDPFTIDEVIDVFNNVGGSKGSISPVPASDIAFKDNGFLRFESIAVGGVGTLRLQTDTNPDVFFELGLFSEVTATGGALKQTQHFDPDRQVALPGQVSMGDGESFRADVINRAFYQLAVNTDRNEGILSRKRIASQEIIFASPYVPTGVPTEEGLQFTGGIEVFTGSGTTPSTGALQNLFAVLDLDGREFVKKVETVLSSITAVFSNTDGKQICTDQGAGVFVVGDEAGEVYVKSGDGSLPAGLQDVPMKILEVESPTVAIIAPVDPVTGTTTLFSTGSVGTDRLTVEVRRCLVDEVRVSQAGARVEGVKTTKDSGTPTRIDKNNRIVISGATFVTNLVQIGDFVTWSGFVDTNPYGNDGDYRVSQVIDEETIEVVADDWGPVYLNPDLVPGAGTVTVSTDGSFYTDPFVRFLPEASGGAVPTSSDSIKILYFEMTTLRDATDDPTSLNGGSVRYRQEADDYTQQTLLAIIGPSSTTLTEYLHDDARNSLEELDYRSNFEHYGHDEVDPGTSDAARVGRHGDIRPDKIDMWQLGNGGETVTIRSTTGEVGVVKLAMRDTTDLQRFTVAADGTVDAARKSTFTRIRSWNHHFQGTQINIEGERADGDAAVIEFRADSNTANPLRYQWALTKDNGINPRMYLNIVNDGTGSAPGEIFTIDNAGRVGVGDPTTLTHSFTARRAADGDILSLEAGTAQLSVRTVAGDFEITHLTNGGGITVQGNVNTSGVGGSVELAAGNGTTSGGTAALTGGSATATGPGGDVTVRGGSSIGANQDGGDLLLSTGNATGQQSGILSLRAATAGAAGAGTRTAENYLTCNGIFETIRLHKDLDAQNNDILNPRLINFNTQASDPATNPGDMWVHTTSGRPSMHDGTQSSSFVMQPFSMSTPVSRTTTGVFSTTYSIPAGTMRSGSVIRIQAMMRPSAVSVSNGTQLTLKFDGEIVAITPSTGTDIIGINSMWLIEAQIVVEDAGTTGVWNSIGKGMWAGQNGSILQFDGDLGLSVKTARVQDFVNDSSVIDLTLGTSATGTFFLYQFTVDVIG